MGRCEECKDRGSREIPARCVACVVELEAKCAQWACDFHALKQDAGIESSALDELRQKAEKRCEEAEARLAVVMGKGHELFQFGYLEELQTGVGGEFAALLADTTPAAKRLRAIVEAAEAETDREMDLSDTFHGPLEEDTGMEEADERLWQAREARRKAVRGEAT